MASFLRDVAIKNVVMTEDAIQELNQVFTERIQSHNRSLRQEDSDRELLHWYIVRFDGRGYRSLSAQEAWGDYKRAQNVERVVMQAVCKRHNATNNLVGEHLDIRLDAGANTTSHIIVGGEDRDWVESTFGALETVLRRHRDAATAVIRMPWTGLLLQFLGVIVGLLLALWLSVLTAPLLKGMEYPRAVAFGLWFLAYSNLWTFLQRQAMDGIEALFPNVRFSRGGDHWVQSFMREGVKTVGVAVLLYLFGKLSVWVSTLVIPLVTAPA
ncbi:hypothetical protein [Roseateles noduli]|uniref:hypothetical protein n=1 Tax=Roseateles noduli TaxID=2052484 RepID=UPI003D64716E